MTNARQTMIALLALLLTSSAALAQTVETSTSTMHTCVDREGIKRLRNYPCGEDERSLDRLRLKTTTVQFGASGAAVKAPLTKAEQHDAAEARNKARSGALEAACGVRPKQPALHDSKAIAVYSKADTAYNACLFKHAARGE